MVSPKTLIQQRKTEGYKPEPARNKDGSLVERVEREAGTHFWNRGLMRKRTSKHSHAKHKQPGTIHQGRTTLGEK
jgi:hypothetical protein